MRRDLAVAVKAILKLSFSQKIPKSKTDLKFKNLVRTVGARDCSTPALKGALRKDPKKSKELCSSYSIGILI